MKIPLQQLTLYSSMKLFLAIKKIPVSWIHPLNTFSSQQTMSRGRPLKVLISETYRGPSGNSQVTNTKTDDLIKKLSFIDNSPCIACLFLFYTRRANNQKFQAGTSTEHLRNQLWDVLGTKWWDVLGTPLRRQSNMLFEFNLQTH